MQIIGVLVGVLVIGALLVDEGEIVALETRVEDRVFVTQLWVVHRGATQYLRSGTSETDWLVRLRADPRVGLRAADADHGAFARYQAVLVSDVAVRDRVNREMAEKYGFADVLWSWIIDRSDAVVIELSPIPDADAGSTP